MFSIFSFDTMNIGDILLVMKAEILLKPLDSAFFSKCLNLAR